MIRTSMCVCVAAVMMIASSAATAGVFVGVEDQSVAAPTSGTTTVNIELFIELTNDTNGNDIAQGIASINLPVDLIDDPAGISQPQNASNSSFGSDLNIVVTDLSGSVVSDYAEALYSDFSASGDVNLGAGRSRLLDIEIEVDSTVVPGTYEIRINTTDTAPGLFEIADVNGVPIDVDGSTVGTLTVIPEPATVAMLGLGGLALLRRRRAG